MYVEVIADTLITFSDLHGNGENVDQHLSHIFNLSGRAQTLFLGDAIDRWFPKLLTSEHDPDGDRLLSAYNEQLRDFVRTCPSHTASDFFEGVEAALKGKAFQNLPVGLVRRSLIGAIASYKTLQTIRNIPDIVFLLGNHEIDLLSGAWLYRSLQKSFFLNICGVSGIWCLEYRDAKSGMQPFQKGAEMAELRNTLLHSGAAQAIRCFQDYDPLLGWLCSRPLLAGFNEWLFMHGGPTLGFVSLLERFHSQHQLNCFIESELQEKGFGSTLFRETKGSGDTFLSPRYHQDHFINDLTLVERCTCFFNKQLLVVGHSALLGASNWNDPITKRIAFLSGKVLKLDAGKKRHFDNGYHYAVIKRNSLQAYQFIEGLPPTSYVP